MAIQPDERAFPYAWNANCTWGFTKRELVGLRMAQAMVEGLYAFQGGLGQLTEADVAKSAWKMADQVIKKS